MQRALQRRCCQRPWVLPHRRCLHDAATGAAAGDGGLPPWPAGSKPVYITTPIFYVNGVPHVGHLYTALLGDALARWYRDVRAAPTFLAVGTDEHGLKVQQAAEAAGQPTERYANERSAAFRKLFDTVGVGYDRFVRTSEADHARTVSRVWRQLASAGHIHRGEHAGWCARSPWASRYYSSRDADHRLSCVWLLHAGVCVRRYCVADETFVPEAQVVQNSSGERVSGESGRAVEWACEDNYLFQLRKQLPALKKWVGSYPSAADQVDGGDALSAVDVDVGDAECEDDQHTATGGEHGSTSDGSVAAGWRRRVTPAGAAGWVDAALRAEDPGAGDDQSNSGAGIAAELSVSRPASRVAWGVGVPDDPDHTVYVWLDALSNYLTAADCGVQNGASGDGGDLAHVANKLPLWPPDHQIVGKDILKFHSIYWPAFLAAAGISLPERLHVHSHWQAHDGAKMSKTSGNVVCPNELISTYGVEATRYYLLRDGPQGSKDSSFDEEMLIRRCNTDLANTLGNLLTRVAAPRLCPEQAWCVAVVCRKKTA